MKKGMQRATHGRKSGSRLLALEPRVLLDAAFGATVLDAMDAPTDTADVAATTQDDGGAAELLEQIRGYQPPERQTEGKELVFIDSRVQDSEQLISQFSRDAQVVVLSSDTSGVEQISDTLKQYEDVRAIHVISHAGPGVVTLGADSLDSDNLGDHQAQLESWGNSLSEGADILLYGCNLADGEQGTTFINQLAELSGGDVAASTGNGGDWDLEFTSGRVSTDSMLPRDTEYARVLAGNPPTAITLTGSSVSELAATGTVIGTLTTTDTDQLTGHSYTITASDFAAGTFDFSGNQLIVGNNTFLDYESLPSGNITVQSTDTDANSISQVFTITIIDESEIITWTNSSTDNQWSNASNWNLGRLPTATDGVVITGTSTLDASYVIVNSTAVARNITLTSEELQLDGGSLTLASDSIFAANSVFSHNNGTLINNADLSAAGRWEWNDGTLTGSGSVTIEATGTFDFAPSGMTSGTYSPKVLEQKLNHESTTGNSVFRDFNILNGSGLNITTNGVFTNTGNLEFDTSSLITGSGLFWNKPGGLMDLTGVEVEVTIQGKFNNDGIFRISNIGFVNIEASGSHSGNFDIQNIKGAFIFGSGDSTVNLNSGTRFTSIANLSLYSGVFFEAATTTIEIAGDVTSDANTILYQNDATLRGPGTLKVDGAFFWSGGIQTGTGKVVISSTGAIQLADMTQTTRVLDGRTLSIDSTAGSVFNDPSSRGLSFANGGQLVVNAGGLLELADNGPLAGAGTIVNNGQINRTTSFNSLPVGVDYSGSGTLSVVSGTLALSGAFNAPDSTIELKDGTLASTNPIQLENGWLTGSGTLQADLGLGQSGGSGGISPGIADAPTGTLYLFGQITGSASANVHFDIGGITQYDVINYDTLPNLAGNLNINLINGFTPANGDTFDIFYNWGALARAFSFSNFVLPAVAAGDTWQVNDTGTSYQLKVVTNTPPVANNDSGASFTTNEDTALTFNGADLLANDTDADLFDKLTIVDFTSGSGTITDNANGTYTYTPLANINGSDTFNYSIQDGRGGTASATVTFTINPVNDIPTGGTAISSISPVEGDTLTASNTLADNDVLGSITYTWEGSSDNGSTWNFIANGASLLMTQNEVGKLIKVVASYTDGDGTLEQVPSSETAAVVNVNDLPGGAITLSSSSPTQGDVLTLTDTLTDADGMTRPIYTWQASSDGGTTWSDISSGVSLTLTQAQVDAQIRVQARYTDQQGTIETVFSTPTQATLNLNDPVTGSLDLSNTAPAQGDTLTAINSLADVDGMGPLSYSWEASNDGGSSWSQVGTAASLTLGQAQVGSLIRVVGSYTDGSGTAEQAISAASSPVANVNDLPQGSLLITGTPSAGQLLMLNSSGVSDLDGIPASVNYQWLRDGQAIVGATGTSYLLTPQDAGSQISATLSYVDDQGTSESVTSAATPQIGATNYPASGLPLLVGNAQEDTTLTVDTSQIADTNGLGAFSYQWNRNGTPITGATGISYTAGDADVGLSLTVTLTFVDAQGFGESLTSDPSPLVANVNDLPTGGPIINGQLIEGQTLTASNNLGDLDGLGTITYNWYTSATTAARVAWNLVATGASYTLTAADVGQQLRLVASYVDGHATSEMVERIAAGVITEQNTAPTGVPDGFVIALDTASEANGNLLTNDQDAEGDRLSVTRIDGDTSGRITTNVGTLLWSADGNFSYLVDTTNPALQQLGAGELLTESFTYYLVDPAGEGSSSVLTLSITGSNDAPLLISPLLDQNHRDGQQITLNLASAFSDPDGEGLNFTATGLPPGLILASNGTISGTLTAAASSASPYTVSITATDAAGAAAQGSFSWTLINPSPQAVSDAFNIVKGTSQPISGNLLDNDFDQDGDALRVTQVNGQPASSLETTYGTLEWTANGQFRFTLNNAHPSVQNLASNGMLTDQLTYTITDAQGATSVAPLMLHINGVNSSPNAGDVLMTLIEDEITSVSGNLASESFDLDGDSLKVLRVTGGDLHGTLEWAEDGRFTYTLNNESPEIQSLGLGTALTETYQFDLTDGQGFSSSASLRLTIDGSNDAPILPEGLPDQTGVEKQPITPLKLADYITDRDTGDTLTVQVNNLPPGLSVNAAGVVTGVLDAEAATNGPYLVEVEVTDQHQAVTLDSFTWQVGSSSPPPTNQPDDSPEPDEPEENALNPTDQGENTSAEFIIHVVRGEGLDELYISDTISARTQQEDAGRPGSQQRDGGDEPLPEEAPPEGEEILVEDLVALAETLPPVDTATEADLALQSGEAAAGDAVPLSNQLNSEAQRFATERDAIFRILEDASRLVSCGG